MSVLLLGVLTFAGVAWLGISVAVAGWKLEEVHDIPTALAWGILWPVVLVLLVFWRACGLLRDALQGKL